MAKEAPKKDNKPAEGEKGQNVTPKDDKSDPKAKENEPEKEIRKPKTGYRLENRKEI